MRANGPNEALRRALDAAGYSAEALAEQSGFHPKQVGRWISDGVIPRRPGAKAKVAELLGVDEADIWPAVAFPPNGPGGDSAEIIEAWAHRADAPKARWWDLLTQAEDRISLLAYAMLFLPEDHPGLVEMLRSKAAHGCQVRIAVADPGCHRVAERGVEEDMPLAERIRYSLRYFAPLAGTSGIELRTHCTPLYASVFVGDGEAFWTPHLYALPGPLAPLFHVRRMSEDGIHASLTSHVDRVWETAEPWHGSTSTTTPTHQHLTA